MTDVSICARLKAYLIIVTQNSPELDQAEKDLFIALLNSTAFQNLVQEFWTGLETETTTCFQRFWNLFKKSPVVPPTPTIVPALVKSPSVVSTQPSKLFINVPLETKSIVIPAVMVGDKIDLQQSIEQHWQSKVAQQPITATTESVVSTPMQ